MTPANDNELRYLIKKSGRARQSRPALRTASHRAPHQYERQYRFFGLKSNERCSPGRNPQVLEVNLLLLEQEQTRLDTRHEKRSTFEERVGTPRTIEARLVVADRVDVEIAYFNRICRV